MGTTLIVIGSGIIALALSMYITTIRMIIRVNAKFGEDSYKLQDGSGRIDPIKIAHFWGMYWNDEL